MPGDSRVSLDEVEAGVVVNSLKPVVSFLEDDRKVLGSRLEAIVLEEASVGAALKLALTMLEFIAMVDGDVFVVVVVLTVVLLPRLYVTGGSNSVLASAIDQVEDDAELVEDSSNVPAAEL